MNEQQNYDEDEVQLFYCCSSPSLIVCGHYRDGNSFITTFRRRLLHLLLRLLQSERESDAFVVVAALGPPHKYLFYGLVLWTLLLLLR